MNINLIQILAAVLLMALLVVVLWRYAKNKEGRRSAIVPTRHKGFRRHWRKIYLLPIGLQRLRSWFGMAEHSPSMQVEFANIGEGNYGDGVRSYIPDAATTARYLLYKKGTDVDHCAITGAGDDPLGPSDDQAAADSVPIAIKLLGAVKGTVRVVTDGSVNDGDYVKCGAVGKVTQAATTNLTFGRAIIPTDSSKADGDVITIIPVMPAKYVF